MKSILYVSLIFMVISIGLGCGSRGKLPGLVPVHGIVIYNDQPLAEATVTFFPAEKDGRRNAVALTDAQGKFTMRTLKANDGISPGEYRVSVTKIKAEKGDPDQFIKNMNGQVQSSSSMGTKKPIHEIPEKYASPDTSELTVSIAPKGNLNIELKLKK